MAHPANRKDAPLRRIPVRTTPRPPLRPAAALPGGAPPATPEAWPETVGAADLETPRTGGPAAD
ncbi:MAG TPA: hypothetical protein PKC50_05660, partial [Elusimicrobiota bacterium]|nr:hypothetical protein [Elusimicrobiota bacterium]